MQSCYSKRGHGTISSLKIRSKDTGSIPSAEEFILKIKAKYNENSDNQPQRPSNELDIMNDWLSEQNRKKQVLNENAINKQSLTDPKEHHGNNLSDFRKLFRMGISLFDSGEYKEASEYFGRALKIDPNNKSALKYLLKSFYFVRMNKK